MAKGERDWAQLDAFDAEYRERLESEAKRGGGNASAYLAVLSDLAQGRRDFYADELKAPDDATRRLFALRGKIRALREKLGLPNADLLDAELPFVRVPEAKKAAAAPDGADPVARIRFLADPAPPGTLFPVTFDEIKTTLSELPRPHVAPVREIRLSARRNAGADGDWLDGEIRLHCLLGDDGRRLMGRRETGMDVERFGGTFERDNKKLYARWPLDAFKVFVLRRVLIHEVAHGVAELPGFADAARRAGSVEKFCEQYAEAFYKPAGKSVRLGF